MTETVLSSSSKEVVIEFDQPFVVIGERIGKRRLLKLYKVPSDN